MSFLIFFSLRERKGRLRRKMRRSNKISMTPLTQPVTSSNSEDIELKSYKRSSSSPGHTHQTQKVSVCFYCFIFIYLLFFILYYLDYLFYGFVGLF